jgi:hypothetical protein
MCAFDFAFCATAGAVAAATGAAYNGDHVTAYIVRTGALGGLISSGILNFASFVADGGSTTAVTTSFALSTFGNAFTVALAISHRVLGSSGQSPILHFSITLPDNNLAPNAILVGAVAGAAPLMVGLTYVLAGGK